jgi:hypothetical protein
VRLPVSVVIPTIPSREAFLRERCLPAIAENGEMEIIVIPGLENGNVKRNRGMAQASNPYILHVDDDCVLRPGCVRRMLDELEADPTAAFAYSDLERCAIPGIEAPPSGTFVAGPFSVRRLRIQNYINTTSLVRKSAGGKWDESLERFQDWDFWLGIVLAGGIGKYIPEVLYEMWCIGESITTAVKANPSIEMIVAKYRLNL